MEKSAESESCGISGGGVAGIVLGMRAILALFSFIFWFLNRKNKQKAGENEKEDTIWASDFPVDRDLTCLEQWIACVEITDRNSKYLLEF